MVAVEELLLETLEQLGQDDFKTFKWYLQLPELYIGFSPIPWYKLEKANRVETVTAMVQKYTHGVVECAETVLRKMTMNELAQSLSDRRSELEDTGASSSAPQAAPLPHPPADSSRPEDVGMHLLQPLEKQIKHFQRTIQTFFKSKFMCVQEGMAESTEEQCLEDIFIELYITDGGEIHINEQHEIMLIRNSRTTAVKPIDPSDIFKSPIGKPLRTVLTTGVAGIGKTFLVKKFVLDWAEGRKNQDVHLIFPFSFSELNLLKGQSFSLAELIHRSIWETKAITEKDLNVIFANLQASGICDFNYSQYKLLFVLDGLDESRIQMDLMRAEPQPVDFDVTQSTSLEVLLSALVRGNLLPSARVWITTRPAAAGQFRRGFIKRMTVVRGFTDPQKEEYFQKKFPDKEQCRQIITHIKASRSLFIMCHIPVFCWITSTVLQDVLKNKTSIDLPTTLTEMYTEFLMYQITLTGERCGKKKSIQYIKSLAKLAFDHLEKGNLFYETDLRNSGLDFRKVSQNIGVFTEVFKEVRKWKDNDKGRMFRFVHLTLQEYLAALHVVMSLINDNKNVLSGQKLKLEDLCMLCRRKPITEVHEVAIQKALSSNGRLDLFLRFLLGLSLKTNQDLLKCMLNNSNGFPQTNHQHTIQSIKTRIRENISPERCINLFHCLNELRDDFLVKEIQQNLSSGSLSTSDLSPAHWSALVFILLSSEDTLEVFDLKKYCPSGEGLLRLIPVVKASNKSLLSNCNLSDNICEALASVLSSESSRLRELDLSDNNLQDSGVKLLCVGLESPNCVLQSLRLSACMISEKGCASLASALRTSHSNLKELDLSFNHPGDSGVKVLSALQQDPNFQLETLNLDYCGEQRLTLGLKKYVCELTLDENSAQRNLKLSHDCRTVTTVEKKQAYPHHPERFDCWLQVLGSTGLTGRCYWEVKWTGMAYIAVTYKRIIRKGEGADSCLGANNHSWTLLCQNDVSFSVQHESKVTQIRPRFSPASDRVAVFLDFQAGILSFYKVTPVTLIHLHTFKSTFTEPLFPAFGFGFSHRFRNFGSSVSLCETQEVIYFSDC